MLLSEISGRNELNFIKSVIGCSVSHWYTCKQLWNSQAIFDEVTIEVARN